MSDGASEQQKLDLFGEMNRYGHRHEDWPSDAVFDPPRRTLANYWRKWHAARDCGASSVRFVEQTTHRSTREKYAYDLRCWSCGHRVPEDEILFIGGDWFSQRGWEVARRSLDDLWLPEERVLELGPDPDREDLRDALDLTRVENGAQVPPPPFDTDKFRSCEACGHEVPVRFDDRCRMCYDGPWTDRMQQSLTALERHVREWHNNSFVHRLEQNIDPLRFGDVAAENAILWRRHDAESTSKLVEVTGRFEDVDDGHMEYVVEDPTLTCRWQYREEDLADCFWATGLYNKEHTKAVQDDRIREVYQRVCDHSFSEVHDPETKEVTGEQCRHCRKRREVEQ